MTELFSRLSARGLIDSAGNIILEQYPDGGYQGVDAEWFKNEFGNAIDGLDQSKWHSALVATDNGRGYARFFDVWKALGVL